MKVFKRRVLFGTHGLNPRLQIAVEGCCHGELDKIYGRLQELEKTTNDKIDLVLICGDFQVSQTLSCTVQKPYKVTGHSQSSRSQDHVSAGQVCKAGQLLRILLRAEKGALFDLVCGRQS